MPDHPANVTEIVPGQLFAVAGFVPAQRSTSWIMPGLTGQLAVPCYVLRDGDEALIVDSGLAIHRDELFRGLDAVLAGTTHRAFAMTRREPDSIINLPMLVQRYQVSPVYCGGALNPVDFFERVDQRNTELHIHAIARTGVTWVSPSETIAVGRLRVDMVRTRLCVLPKTHIVEHATGTLFGSDSWGSLTQPATGAVDIVRQEDARLDRAALAGYLAHKFDWLLGIDTSLVADDVASLAMRYAVQRICPGYGAVIEGASLSRRVIQETAAAIHLLAREPMAQRLSVADGEALSRAVEGLPA
ncbi:MBL fold metallo-hydrolase [Ancylobacter pratisalsi]|uniref:MBL fold metallo-hydrolase n=1 Tax=Ancylobacter pratisalsi TaxID=1745854 RepID=A0A6P1YMV7_9HYPH|nr:MBL fold metallo-hydrolase [Ancylobacter pratisalsi]QIB33114.1 MBL fold metallo-hydrolase [Ancylobacter pratisalsi]